MALPKSYFHPCLWYTSCSATVWQRINWVQVWFRSTMIFGDCCRTVSFAIHLYLLIQELSIVSDNIIVGDTIFFFISYENNFCMKTVRSIYHLWTNHMIFLVVVSHTALIHLNIIYFSNTHFILPFEAVDL